MVYPCPQGHLEGMLLSHHLLQNQEIQPIIHFYFGGRGGGGLQPVRFNKSGMHPGVFPRREADRKDRHTWKSEFSEICIPCIVPL